MSGNLRRQVDTSCGGVLELGRLFRAKWPPYRLTFPVGAASPGGRPPAVSNSPLRQPPGESDVPAALKAAFSSTKQGAAVGKRRLY